MQRCGFLLVCLVVLSGSGTSQTSHNASSSSEFELNPPTVLTSSRMVDSSQLEVVLTIDEEVVELTPTNDGKWTVETGVTPNEQHTVEVKWVENIGDEQLVLARSSRIVTISEGFDDTVIEFKERRYSTDIDSDSDGRSNLSEREDGTNPFDRNSPGVDLTDVAVEFQINIPADFESAPIDFNELFMVVTGSNAAIPMTRRREFCVCRCKLVLRKRFNHQGRQSIVNCQYSVRWHFRS